MSSPVIALLALFGLLFVSTAIPPTLAFDPSSAYPYLTTDTFTNIKNSPAERFVLFYFSSSPSSATALSVLNTAARRLRTKFPSFIFQHCDGDQAANKAEFEAAGFKAPGEWLFTATPVEGIMKYTGPVTVADLVDHVRHKYLPSNPSDVLRFTTEDAFYETMDSTPTPSPLFVKFFEPWCEHCKRLAPTFSMAASFFKDSSVRFLEVQCSLDEDTRRMCEKNAVTSYPVLMLFTGEHKVRYDKEMRSVAEFDRFFVEHVQGFTSRVQQQRKGASKQTEQDQAQQEARTQSVTGEKQQGKLNAVVAVTNEEKTVEARLGALEAQLQDVQSSLRAIQRGMEKLLAQRA